MKRRPRPSNPPLNYFQVQVFLIWMKRTTSIYQNLSLNIIREICRFFMFRPQLAKCRAFDLVVVDLREMHYKVFDTRELPLARGVPPECVCIGDNRILICGGGEIQQHRGTKYSAATYVIAAGSAVALSDMGTARNKHGLIYYEPSRLVFAFGGVTLRGISSRCEQYSLARDLWSPLPDMNKAKKSISACLHQGKVYLYAFGENVEIFTIATMQFSILPIEAFGIRCMSPHIHSSVLEKCIGLVWKDQLIFIKSDCMKRWNVDTFELIGTQILSKCFYSKSILVMDDTLFILELDEFCWLDLATGHFLMSHSYEE